MKRTNIGLIGCGDISPAYFDTAMTFPGIDITGCADLDSGVARERGIEFGVGACSVEELLANEEIGIVLNLTTPQAHAEINLRALEAGKHVYGEKPLAVTREDGQRVLDLAREKGLRVGCAPDTFLGGGHQTVRNLVDDDVIGRPVSGTAFMMYHGAEDWHPNPGFFYLPGGGPLFDVGPYCLTTLVNLIGPVRRVAALSGKAFSERVAANGERLPVEVQTHVAGTLEFHSGPIITMVTSFDVWRHSNHCMELHGEKGSIQIPDPNFFDGPVRLFTPGTDDWREIPLTHGYTAPSRGMGVADMAQAIQTGRGHRCSGDLAYHVLDVMHAFHESSSERRHIDVTSTCERPAPLAPGLEGGKLAP